MSRGQLASGHDVEQSSSEGRAGCVLDKLEIYPALMSFRDEFFAMTNPGDGTLAFALRAAEMKSDPGEYYLVSSKSGGAAFLSWFEIYGTPASGPTLGSFNIPCGTYNNPPNMPQGNGTFADCGDARLMNARYYLSRVWTTHAQGAGGGTQHLRHRGLHYQLRCTDDCSGDGSIWQCKPVLLLPVG